jgi:hypothetical protein
MLCLIYVTSDVPHIFITAYYHDIEMLETYPAPLLFELQ